MNIFRLYSLPAMSLLAALVVAPVTAEEAEPNTASPPTPANPPTLASPPNPAEFDQRFATALENMNKMHEQMEKIQRTTDPAEREKLLTEHWDLMQSNIDTMQGFWGPGMMMGWGKDGTLPGRGHMMDGPMMGRGHMGGYYRNMTPDQLKDNQYMMNNYMGMQQQMMNHMLWHQQYRNQLNQPAE